MTLPEGAALDDKVELVRLELLVTVVLIEVIVEVVEERVEESAEEMVVEEFVNVGEVVVGGECRVVVSFVVVEIKRDETSVRDSTAITTTAIPMIVRVEFVKFYFR